MTSQAQALTAPLEVLPEENLEEIKIDPVCLLQDTIDSFSLSLFEALRKLRDAVAIEDANNETEPLDFADFMLSLQNHEKYALDIINANDGEIPTTREEYTKCYGRIEGERDADLVCSLAGEVLEKSAKVNHLVRNILPGMERNKEEQLVLMEKLMNENWEVQREIETLYETAEKKRDEVRKVLKAHTCAALGIEGEL